MVSGVGRTTMRSESTGAVATGSVTTTCAPSARAGFAEAAAERSKVAEGAFAQLASGSASARAAVLLRKTTPTRRRLRIMGGTGLTGHSDNASAAKRKPPVQENSTGASDASAVFRHPPLFSGSPYPQRSGPGGWITQSS